MLHLYSSRGLKILEGQLVRHHNICKNTTRYNIGVGIHIVMKMAYLEDHAQIADIAIERKNRISLNKFKQSL